MNDDMKDSMILPCNRIWIGNREWGLSEKERLNFSLKVLSAKSLKDIGSDMC